MHFAILGKERLAGTTPAISAFGRCVNDISLERFAESPSLGAEFRVLADAMPQLVWTAQADGTLEYFNRRWIEYTGLTLDRLRDEGADVGVVHPDELSETWDRWNDALATATPYEMEYRLRRARDATYRWFLSRAEPILDAAGSVFRWIGTATDIDEQRRARDSLAFIVEAGNVFASAPDVETICRALADVTIGHFADWCFVVLVRDGRTATAAIAHKDRDLVRYIEQFRDNYPLRPDEPMAQVIANNVPLLVERIFPRSTRGSGAGRATPAPAASAAHAFGHAGASRHPGRHRVRCPCARLRGVGTAV